MSKINKIQEIIQKKLHFFEKTVKGVRKRLKSVDFMIKHKQWKESFTRNRKLNFEIMIILMLQKGVKSLQLRLNEFFTKLGVNTFNIASKTAFSLARHKISHTAFIELNKEIIIDNFYDKIENEGGYKTWNGYRLLAVDGSKLRLPDTQQIKEYYGEIKVKNQYGEQGTYTGGLLSVLYDVENNLAIDSILEKGNYSERALTIRHIQNLNKDKSIENGNLTLFDRGYFSKYLIGLLQSYKIDFVFRLSTTACKECQELFSKECKINSKVVSLEIEKGKIDYSDKYGIQIDKPMPKIIKVRFVRVILDNGEIEVLASSLLDETKYSNSIFKDLYFKRWRIEVYYDVLKNRLGLENFSGKSVESIKQDLYSSIFLSNFESIATISSNAELELKSQTKNLKHEQQVNKQVSFNIIKNKVMDLFLSDKSKKKQWND